MSRLEPEVQKAVNELIKTLNSTDAFKEYKELKERLEQNQEELNLVKKSQEIRKRLNDLPGHELDNEYAERLFEEYEELCDNTVVYRIEHAELKLGKTLRLVLDEIFNAMELE